MKTPVYCVWYEDFLPVRSLGDNLWFLSLSKESAKERVKLWEEEFPEDDFYITLEHLD